MKNIIICLMALMGYGLLSAQTITFSFPEIEGDEGSTTDLEVSVDNGETAFVAFQCDIVLPEGVKIPFDEDEEEYMFEFSNRALSSHSYYSNYVSSKGCYRFVIINTKSKAFKGSDGLLFTCPLELDAIPGEYTVTIDNIKVTTMDSNNKLSEVYPADAINTLTIRANNPFAFNVQPGTPTYEIGLATLNCSVHQSNFTNVKEYKFWAVLATDQSAELGSVTIEAPSEQDFEVKIPLDKLNYDENKYMVQVRAQAIMQDGTSVNVDSWKTGDPEGFTGDETIEIDTFKSVMTGVDNINVSDLDPTCLRFNLHGILVDDSYRGVIIVNGKKILK